MREAARAQGGAPGTANRGNHGHAMKSATFQAFQSLIYDTSGIHLSDDKAGLVLARIGKRIRTLGMRTPEEYLACLKREGGETELVRLIDAISTNVTSFFRESFHFDFLQSAIADGYAQGQRRFRIWSAASSTGEEPYTIAMTLSEAVPLENTDTRILATDISTRVLEHAIAGVYTEDRLAGIPPHLLRRSFHQIQGRTPGYRVVPELRELVTFKRLNLSQPPYPLKGPFDVIFCRNVMIYFDNALRGRLLADFHRLLRPGGYLLVGHAESLSGLKHTFQTVHPAVYRKRGE